MSLTIIKNAPVLDDFKMKKNIKQLLTLKLQHIVATYTNVEMNREDKIYVYKQFIQYLQKPRPKLI